MAGGPPGDRTQDCVIKSHWQKPIRTDQTALLQAHPDQTRSVEDATFGFCRTLSHTDDGSQRRMEGSLSPATYRPVGTRAWSSSNQDRKTMVLITGLATDKPLSFMDFRELRLSGGVDN